ncbi:MAG TPA: asparagine synthase (glutamine-hydrolyzing) [Symbiobacteriaceae bacterium]|nr:asparagine synthase (glutamine-hydrolyzing) [Symbiobacteriaceae bacterium]
MCGITGWIDWKADLTRERRTLEAMTAALANRGPDATGMYLTQHAGLGHRRLTIIDPEGGAQPMTRRYGDRTYTIVYNGELYNTAEVRRELETRGHTFFTRSDTEVLLVSYIEWGPACVEQLNGIFAFGVWEEHAQRLYLARDRMGVKPLFYAHRGGALLFASELKSLLANPLVLPEVDSEGLSEVLFLGPSRTPGHGVFRGVSELRPGHWLLHEQNQTRVHQYWALESRPHTDDLERTASTVRDLVTDAVRRQLVSDVPIGTLLSGGLDSSIITALAAGEFRAAGHPLQTWTIDYRDNDQYFQASAFQPDSDAYWARRVNDLLDTEPHEVVIDTPELVESLKTAVAARDLPGMADVDSSLYLFCKAIKQELTVVLSGECADEVFGGYPWFRQSEALESDTFPWVRLLPERTALLHPALRSRLNPGAYVADRYHQTVAEVPRLPGEDPVESRRRTMFYLNLNWFMATLLDRKDRMSMAAGLEARVPFCDHRIVEYVWNIPWSMKMCDDREKGILRRAMRGVLPDDVLYRRKSPYPKTHNPAYCEAVRNWVLELLDDPGAPLHQIVDATAVRELARKEAPASGMPWFGQLMSLPQLFAFYGQIDTWLRTYKVSLV